MVYSTYDIKTNRFSWHNDNGQVAYTYSMEEFSQRYSHEDSSIEYV